MFSFINYFFSAPLTFEARLKKINYDGAIPYCFRDPISIDNQIMEEPITLNHNRSCTLDKTTLEQWLAKNKTSPFYNDTIANKTCNYPLKKQIDEFVSHLETINDLKEKISMLEQTELKLDNSLNDLSPEEKNWLFNSEEILKKAKIENLKQILCCERNNLFIFLDPLLEKDEKQLLYDDISFFAILSSKMTEHHAKIKNLLTSPPTHFFIKKCIKKTTAQLNNNISHTHNNCE